MFVLIIIKVVDLIRFVKYTENAVAVLTIL